MSDTYSGWEETTGQDDTHEIDDTFEIDDYRDISIFFDELFGEHDVFLVIYQDLKYEEKLINLEYEERLINIQYEERLINIQYEIYSRPNTTFSNPRLNTTSSN
jgi:hypothetical protein